MSTSTPTTIELGDDVVAAVVHWNATRGFGFARVAGRNVFIPARSLRNATDLRRGDHVRAEVRMDRQGRLFLDHVTLVEQQPATKRRCVCGEWFTPTTPRQSRCRPSCGRQQAQPGLGL